MGWLRSEEEVDEMIEEMIKKSKGKYITQGVSFNKDNKRQLELLKMVLMRSGSFSGFVKELLARESEGSHVNTNNTSYKPVETVEKKDTGNFF